MTEEVGEDFGIRMAAASDVPLLAEFNQALIRDEQHRNPMSLEELVARMSEFLRTGHEAALFESGGETLGYALFRAESEHLYLRQFYVRPEFRRRGVGRIAVRRLRETAWRNHSGIRLDVLTTNSAAQEFWRSVGFCDYCVTMEWERGDDGPPRRTTAAPTRQQG